MTESTAVLIFVLHCFNHHPALSHSEPVPEEGTGGGGLVTEREKQRTKGGRKFLAANISAQDRPGHKAAVSSVELESAVSVSQTGLK